jgi:OmpA-OmpF porin, OOP family
MRKSFRGLLIVPVLTYAAAAQAQSAGGSPFYGGISLGQSQVRFSEDFLSFPGATGESLSKDETGNAYKVFIGYRVSRNFAVEGGYTNFGEFSATNNISAIALFGPGSLSFKFKSSGFNMDAVGILPISDAFEAFGKLGLIYTTSKATFSGTGSVTVAAPGVPPNATQSEVNLKAGIGAEYHFVPALGLRVEYERIFKVGDENKTGEGDIGMFSLGLTVRF